jgi:hypothetical protein
VTQVEREQQVERLMAKLDRIEERRERRWFVRVFCSDTTRKARGSG